MKFARLLCVSLALLGLRGCATTPGPAPLPYAFSLGGYTDARPNDDDKLMSPYAFDISQFMTSWTQNTTVTLFGQQQVKLRVKLVNYASSSFHNRFAVSMVAELSATDAYGRPMGKTTAECSAVENRGADIGELITEARRQGPTVFRAEARDLPTWRRVFGHCVEDLRQSFLQTLISQPSQERSPR